MSKSIPASNFRNPVFIFLCYLLLVLPYFSILCSIDLSDKLFWSGVRVCANEFLVDSFLESSVLTLAFVIIILETLNFADQKLNLGNITTTTREWFFLQLKAMLFLLFPFVIWLLLSSVFAYVAVSTGREFPQETWIQSLIKVQSFGLLALNLNTYLKNRFFRKNPLSKKLEVKNGIGPSSILLAEIVWIEKIDNKYFVFGHENKFETSLTLQEMEIELPGETFKRVNRSTIVNLNEINSFSFWENEKYILTLKNKKEFVVTRKRVLELKKALENQTNFLRFLEKISFLKVFGHIRN